MKKSQSGFTLIELVVVIVLLGILGVTALGKFQDLSGQAQTAAVNAVAAEITGASTINYATRLLDVTAGEDFSVADVCTDVIIGSILTTGIPSGYAITGTGDCSGANAAGTTVACTLTHTASSTTASPPVICSN